MSSAPEDPLDPVMGHIRPLKTNSPKLGGDEGTVGSSPPPAPAPSVSGMLQESDWPHGPEMAPGCVQRPPIVPLRDWVMPPWMEPFRSAFNARGFTLEDLMNDRCRPGFATDHFYMTRMKAERWVGVLQQLHANGLLVAPPAPVCRCWRCQMFSGWTQTAMLLIVNALLLAVVSTLLESAFFAVMVIWTQVTLLFHLIEKSPWVNPKRAIPIQWFMVAIFSGTFAVLTTHPIPAVILTTVYIVVSLGLIVCGMRWWK